MKIQYLGTAAAEGLPGLFCNCNYCKQARKLKGKDYRTRSQAIIDNRLLVDYPADSYNHMIMYDMDLPNLHSILITHTHQDHLYLEDLGLRFEVFSSDINGQLTLYGNDALAQKYNAFYKADLEDTHLDGKLGCVELSEFITVDIEGYAVTPLLANHDKQEKCFIYLVEKDGKAILYGNDTGWFPEKTWEYLSHKRIDLVSLDCTTLKYKDGTNHMGIEDVLEVKARLKSLGCTDSTSVFVITHFSHNGHMLHSQIEEAVLPYNITVAYDGLEVEF